MSAQLIYFEDIVTLNFSVNGFVGWLEFYF